MPLIAHPAPGTIVRVDLSDGFRPPEKVKRRPAIVLSRPIPGRKNLCSIVPLSTTKPKIELAHHFRLVLDPPLPRPYDSPEMWVKGDIVLTVAFHRLRLLFSRGEDGQKRFDERILDPVRFEAVKTCVRAGLGL